MMTLVMSKKRSVSNSVCVLIAAWSVFVSTAQAWNAHGHRVITQIALDRLPAEAPGFLRNPSVVARIVEQSVEPDRWRGIRLAAINHEDNQDHYINVEDLERFGLSLGTMPRLRYEYVREMVLAAERAPERMAPYDPSQDPDRNRRFPGFLPHAIAGDYAKLASAMQTYRLLEALGDPTRAHQLEQARENVVYHMGVLAHWVGDAAQPLHTTRHHHGWVGPNPMGYTTDRGFHAYIDGAIVDHHAMSFEALRHEPAAWDGAINPRDPWPAIIAHIERSFAQVEPVYRMHRDGTLTGEPGRELIAARLVDGGVMLTRLYAAAWEASTPTDADAAAFVRFNEHRPGAATVPNGEVPKPAGQATP